LINDNPDPDYEPYMFFYQKKARRKKMMAKRRATSLIFLEIQIQIVTTMVICRKKFHVPLYADDASVKIGKTFRVRENCHRKVNFSEKCPVGKIVNVVRKKGAPDKTILYYKFFNYTEHRRPPSLPLEYSALAFSLMTRRRSVSSSGMKRQNGLFPWQRNQLAKELDVNSGRWRL
jgi:hypothetical protein